MKKFLLVLALLPGLSFGAGVSWMDGVTAYSPNSLPSTGITMDNTGCVNIKDAGGTAIGVLCLDASDDLNIGDATGVDNINLDTAGTITFSSVTGTNNFAGPAAANNTVEIQATTGHGSFLRMQGDDVAQPITSLQPADIWLNIQSRVAADGGLAITSISDNGTPPLLIRGYFGATNPNDNTPAINFRVGKSDGATSATDMAAAETVLQVSGWNGITEYLTIYGSGAQATGGTDPALSSCGTTPSIVGSDFASKVTIGSGVTTSCTITFANTGFANAPACVVTGDNTAIGYAATTTTTVLTITSSADMASDVISFICVGT